MSNKNFYLKRYLRQVRRELAVIGKGKEQCFLRIRESILNYLEENPNADLASVQARFGSPAQIAAAYVYDQEPTVFLKRLDRQKKVILLVAVPLSLLVLVRGAYLIKDIQVCKSESVFSVEIMKHQDGVLIERVVIE